MSSPATPAASPRRALVLGGGGVAGIAWQVGLAAGLAQAGLGLSQAELFIGTSAGAIVAAQLSGSLPLAHWLQEQLAPPADSPEQFRPYSQEAADARNRQLMDKVQGDLRAARQRIGAHALRSVTPSLAERRHIVQSRLRASQWPQASLRVVAVDAHSGERRVFDAHSGVDFVDAICASCAVPGSWPVVPVGDNSYMDGGVHSITNADIALGAARVLVLSPFGYSEGNPVSGHLQAEVQQLRAAGASVWVIEPDAGARAAMSSNVLDPSRRTPSAQAGIAQAQAVMPLVQAFLG